MPPPLKKTEEKLPPAAPLQKKELEIFPAIFFHSTVNFLSLQDSRALFAYNFSMFFHPQKNIEIFPKLMIFFPKKLKVFYAFFPFYFRNTLFAFVLFRFSCSAMLNTAKGYLTKNMIWLSEKFEEMTLKIDSEHDISNSDYSSSNGENSMDYTSGTFQRGSTVGELDGYVTLLLFCYSVIFELLYMLRLFRHFYV